MRLEKDAVGEAIKLLQSRGYEVFSKHAELTVRTTLRVDNRYHNDSLHHESYMNSMQGRLCSEIARLFHRDRLVDFAFYPDSGERNEFLPGCTSYQASMNFFPATRKEWRR